MLAQVVAHHQQTQHGFDCYPGHHHGLPAYNSTVSSTLIAAYPVKTVGGQKDAEMEGEGSTYPTSAWGGAIPVLYVIRVLYRQCNQYGRCGCCCEGATEYYKLLFARLLVILPNKKC